MSVGVGVGGSVGVVVHPESGWLAGEGGGIKIA